MWVTVTLANGRLVKGVFSGPAKTNNWVESWTQRVSGQWVDCRRLGSKATTSTHRARPPSLFQLSFQSLSLFFSISFSLLLFSPSSSSPSSSSSLFFVLVSSRFYSMAHNPLHTHVLNTHRHARIHADAGIAGQSSCEILKRTKRNNIYVARQSYIVSFLFSISIFLLYRVALLFFSFFPRVTPFYFIRHFSPPPSLFSSSSSIYPPHRFSFVWLGQL